MATEDDSYRFVSLYEIPIIEGETELDDALRQLYDRRTGGFVVSEAGKLLGYISGQEIMSNILGSGNCADVMKETISNLIGRAPAKLSITQISDKAISDALDSPNLKEALEKIFVVEGGGEHSGFLFPDRLVTEIHTPIPIYYCTNMEDGPHANTKSSGYCDHCPFPIQS